MKKVDETFLKTKPWYVKTESRQRYEKVIKFLKDNDMQYMMKNDIAYQSSIKFITNVDLTCETHPYIMWSDDKNYTGHELIWENGGLFFSEYIERKNTGSVISINGVYYFIDEVIKAIESNNVRAVNQR